MSEVRRSPAPPDWLFKRVINPTMKGILRSPFHKLLSNGLSIVTFTGRKSGQQYSTPVAYHWIEDGSKVMFMTRSPWWQNLQDGKPIQILIKGKQYNAIPEIIHDEDEVWSYVSEFLDRYGGNTRRVGIMVGDGASESEIRDHAREFIAVKLILS